MEARGLAFALILAASAAQADYDPSQYPAYETCALCHGLFGVSHTGKFPNLGGQKQAYIEAQVRAFRDGHRTNDGGQMVAIVTELQPEDIPFVAEWFARQEAPASYPSEHTGPGAARFTDLGCVTCHDNSVEGDPTVPFLTAQKPDYLIKQMQDFRDGRRDAAEMPGMHGTALSIPDEEIAEIAAYLAAEARP
ncbi:c-type cytochrome [Ovoidimarina sediminis]|uniref:c-type cytochrome n=1 Tax=Ovoidimarina sediminis TaxID=3079856 RepID=UPI00290B289C|nr:c-type cytochrome [Rhodophyticola sp. MJ-SS7]MDU8944623.1 c-type cytochrome [Rhodophyticola sp. MJ-SS7]